VLPANWSARLKELSELEDGWFDGSGDKISRQVLRQTETLLLECLDARVERPRIFPTEKGGVRLEWALEEREVIAEVESGHVVNLFAFSKVDDENEEEKVVGWSDVDEVVDFIRRGIGVSFTTVA
jgi:hypothetical protein